MAMNVIHSPAQPTKLNRISGFFWRNPGLGLFLLLLGPLMWFGIVYFGSLLTLLWQGFYTFDDFTMSVTPDLTLGDFIVPQLVGPPGYFIGNMVYSQQGAIGNMPMAAAFTLVPIVLIALYLAFVKRLGAFDAL